MKISIVVDDQIVIVDGVSVKVSSIDWAFFDGDPSTKWDDIAAVQFDTDAGQGHVEYRTIVTGHPLRPNIRPGDWLITATDFDEKFSFVLGPYKAALEAHRAEEEEAARKAKEASAARTKESIEAYRAAKLVKALNAEGVEVPAAAADDVEALKTKLEAIERTVSAHNQAFQQLDKIAGDGQ